MIYNVENNSLKSMTRERSGMRCFMKRVGNLVAAFTLVCAALVLLPGLSYAGSNSYSTPVDGSAPLIPDGSNQTLLSVTVGASAGGNTVTSYDLAFSGSVTASDVAEVIVNTNGALYGSTTSLGSWPNVSITGGAKPKTTVDVIVRLNPSAASKTVGVTLQAENPNSGGGGLPLSTSSALAIGAAVVPDTLSVTTATPVASSAAPGDTGVQMLNLQLSCSNTNDGLCTIASVTVDDLGTAVTGDIDDMQVYFDADNNFGNGTLGVADNFTWSGTSTVVDTSTVSGNTVTSGTPTYLWIVYSVNTGAATRTIQASVTNIALSGSDAFDATGSPWNSNSIAVTAAAANKLASCSSCHTYPPTDGASRNASDGVVVGSHSKHYAITGVTCATCHVVPATTDSTSFDHRNGNIEMQASIKGGSYSKGASFPQANDLTGAGLGTCSNVSCHYNQVTPQWGSGTTTCVSCHNNGAGEPWPNIGAHDRHFAAFGVSGLDPTNSALVLSWCSICHTGAGSGTSKHADGNLYDVTIDPTYQDQSGGALSYSGGAAGTCSNVSCHGGNVTPAWNNANSINLASDCTTCHRVEATPTEYNSASSGMHAITTSVSGHNHINDSVNATSPCLDCHNGPPSQHFYNPPASTVRSNLNLDSTAMDRPTAADFVSGISIGATVAQDTCAMTCHKDGSQAEGPWPRLNDKTKATASDGSECDTCHGGVNGADTWTFVKQADAHNASDGKVEHFYDWDGDATPEVLTNHNGCKVCHGWNKGDVNANYNATWGTGDHGNGQINMNSDTAYSSATFSCAAACHTGAANNGHNLEASNWPVAMGAYGSGGDCLSCHSTTSTNIPSNPVTQFTGTTYHHIANPTAADCAVCHDSANQKMDSSNPNVLSLRNADTGATILYDQSNPASYRGNLVTFCLACHDGNGALAEATPMTPFSNGLTPPDISQFWQGTTYNSHNYPASATVNTVPVLTKARSAHGFPDTNQLKQDSQATYTNANPVSCLDCHPAHGSNTASPKLTNHTGGAGPDGIDFGTVGGVMVKDTYSEPGTCWGCHDTAGVKDYFGDSTVAGSHWTGTQKSAFGYKQRTYQSEHEVDGTATGIKCSICHNPHGGEVASQYYTPLLRGSWMTSPYLEDRTCSLSGTALPTVYYSSSSGYTTTNHQGPRVEVTKAYNLPSEYGNGYGASGGNGHNGWFIDDNTFGTSGSGMGGSVTVGHISETASQFGGLCANCHAGTPDTGGTVASMQTYLAGNAAGGNLLAQGLGMTNWGAAIHNTVKGWAATGPTSDQVNATNNPNMHQFQSSNSSSPRFIRDSGWYSPRTNYDWGADPSQGNQMASAATAYHQFPCAKCHTPHASSLPRLMITNCIDVGNTNGQRKAHGTDAAWSYPSWPTDAAGWGGSAPVANVNDLGMHCHNKRATNTNGGGGWNKVTGW